MEEKLYVCECMESCESSECKYRKPHKNDGDLVCLGSLVDVDSYKEMVEAMKMKVSKEQRQAIFYIIERCSSCGLDHIVYERDMHRVINSPDNSLVFICPREHTCVVVDKI